MREGAMIVCPVCSGLDPEYRIGLDDLFIKSSRKEYDAIKKKYDEQVGKETLRVHELSSNINSNKSIKVHFYAKCSHCNSKWESEMEIIPVLGDE